MIYRNLVVKTGVKFIGRKVVSNRVNAEKGVAVYSFEMRKPTKIV